MKRTGLKKSHSWWWDSHISPKNSKWLSDNLEEMDQSVKKMLKLVEEDGDSFAKKAEMYYQKRPELISHVEDFYRIYRSLAERYDHLTGELKKNVPSDLQSQGSCVSDISSELPSTWPSPSPDQRISRRKSGPPRAAGFDFFLGSNGSGTDFYQKDGDEVSSLTDSEAESDDSSVNNYSVLIGNGGDHVVNKKIIELEIELREVKDKLRYQQEENADGLVKGAKNEDDLLARIAGYEQDLRLANEKVKLSREEICKLKNELLNYKSSETTYNFQAEKIFPVSDDDISLIPKLQERTSKLEAGTLDGDNKIQALVEELKITKEKLNDSEKEIARLKIEIETNRSEKIQNVQNQLELAQKEVATWKGKLNSEKREVSKLQERITRLKSSLSDRDHEIRDLTIAVSDAEEKIFPEKARIKAEISRLLGEQIRLKEQLRDGEARCRVLEEEVRKTKAEKTQMEERLSGQIEQLKTDIAERDNRIEDSNRSIAALKSERDALDARVITLTADMVCRDDRIDIMENLLQQLHLEHLELNASAEESRKLVQELRSRAKSLEEEIERQRVVIVQGAEEKREAIRQLCFSLEHYRNGYLRLRKAFVGNNKRVAVIAS